MSETITGKLEVKNVTGSFTGIVLNGGSEKASEGQIGSATAGKLGMGTIELKDESGESNLRLTGVGTISVDGAGSLTFSGPAGSIKLKAGTTPAEILIPGGLHFVNNGTLRLGAEESGRGGEGTLFLCDSEGKLKLSLKATTNGGEIGIPGGLAFVNQGTLRLGAEDNGQGGVGTLFLCDSEGKLKLSLKAEDKEVIWIPGMLRFADGSLRLGSEPNGGGKNGKLLLRNEAGKEMITLDGEVGDIFLRNADCAEEFEVADMEGVEPGSVMILDDNGRLQTGYQAYDKRVAGVISGAGDYRPGIVLDKKPAQGNRKPVALVGKAYCKVDASYSSIAVGDLLTTSDTPGHAMKANDPLRAFGAVIGKALRPWVTGTGLIPILIALQ